MVSARVFLVCIFVLQGCLLTPLTSAQDGLTLATFNSWEGINICINTNEYDDQKLQDTCNEMKPEGLQGSPTPSCENIVLEMLNANNVKTPYTRQVLVCRHGNLVLGCACATSSTGGVYTFKYISRYNMCTNFD